MTPVALEPGVPTEIEVELEATSWIFEPGHRVRLSLAGSDWPNVWPPPAGGALAVDRGTVELRLPVLDGPSGLPAPVVAADDGRRHPRGRAGRRPASARLAVRARPDRTRDARGDVATARGTNPSSGRRSKSATTAPSESRRRIPQHAWARGTTVYRIAWPEAEVRTEARLDLRSDAEAYHVVIERGRRGDRRRDRHREHPPRAAVRAHDPPPARVGAGFHPARSRPVPVGAGFHPARALRQPTA